ncbi:MAG: hypothetical protein HZB46_01470, partial [Solirubrobacterales bacterium]|nr:hypothetical protein [Solirubrobacterales bacterium]
VTVRLLRGGRAVATRTVTARRRAFRVTLRPRKAGRYRAVVTARRGGTVLRARTTLRRLR